MLNFTGKSARTFSPCTFNHTRSRNYAMQQHPVAWQRVGPMAHIFPYRAGGNTCPCSWTVHEILVLLSHLSPALRLQRLNRSRTDAYRYLVIGGGDPLLQIELNETLQWGSIELVHPPARPLLVSFRRYTDSLSYST